MFHTFFAAIGDIVFLIPVAGGIIRAMSRTLDQSDTSIGLTGIYAWAYVHRVRLWSLLLLAIFVPMLGIGLYLHPSVKGLATHTQLGLPPCGFYTEYGWPCPTCGYTTAVSHVAHGQWLTALATQPGGAMVGFLAISGVILGALGLTTGKWYGPSFFWFAWNRWKLLFWMAVIVLGAWGYKILIMSAWFKRHW